MNEQLTNANYEEVLSDLRRLVRELDVAMHGEDGAAKQASICDLISPAREMRKEIEHHRESIRCMSAFLRDLSVMMGTPDGDPDALADAIEEMKERNIKLSGEEHPSRDRDNV